MTDRVIEPEAEYLEQAKQLGLVVPEIRVTSKLDTRLARHDRLLVVQGASLYEGVRELEIEQPMVVRFKAYPKHVEDDAEPEIDYELEERWGQATPFGEVALTIDATPTTEEDSERETNVGFWLGLMVLDSLVERKEEIETDRRSRSLKERIATTFAAVGANAGSSAVLQTTIGLHYPFIGIPAQLAVMVGGAIHQNHRFGEDLEDFIEKEMQPRAEQMADNHPVLVYDYKI